MEQYNSYKPSGVEWIGDIPENWDLIKLKYISNLYNGSSLNDNQKELFDSSNIDDIPYVSTKDIDYNSQSIEYDNGLRIPKSNTSFKLGKKGSFLICIEGGSSGKKMGYLEQDVYFVNKLCCFEPKTNSKFQYYYIQTPLFQLQFHSSLSGLIGGVSISLIRNFNTILPPIQEQEQIVNYLDEKTTIIDKLISTKQRKVELLKEQRTTLINQVITKGLNPNVKMKDSGVEWIGEIPEIWNNTTLRYYVNKVGSGITPRGGSEVYVDEGVIFIRSQNVHFNGLRLDDVSRITNETHIGMSGSKVIFNDLLLNITGGSIGRCCVVLNEDEMNVNQHVCIIRTKKEKLSPFFLNYILQSKVGQTQVDYFQTGGNREGLTGENIKNFKISFPNIQEQQEIVDYLDTHTKEIDDLVSMEQKKIELLKEYRQSLISEVITGKIKVV
ncbi:restriction endonuclease subunit S [Flavobacterium sp.]|uniref:restriction endonuclease subunit S n=1 Tax=Flavobacterium sp. TaxID=239 RepID=UPI00261489B4|nr:restriction endonuclease subunit S [Flavobacterium sp.]